MEVDRKRGDLLGESEQINSRVQQARFEFGFKVDNAGSVAAGNSEGRVRHDLASRWTDSRFVKVCQIRDVHQRYDVQRKLNEDGQEHVEVENIAQRSFARKLLDGLHKMPYTSMRRYKKAYTPYLCARDAQETDRHQHPADSHLIITKLDAVKILHTQAVCSDETVQRQDLVHLDRRDQRTATLPDDVGN